jgi:thiamine biosynthesis protein ThiS
MIGLVINGKNVELEGPTPLLGYLETLGVSARGVAVELNGVIIERDAYASTRLGEGDVVEIVKMVGGGWCAGAAMAFLPGFAGPRHAAGSSKRVGPASP